MDQLEIQEREYLTTLENIDDMSKRFHRVIERLMTSTFSPNQQKTLDVRFSTSDAVDLVNRSGTTIREAERNGRLPMPDLTPAGRRAGYKLSDLARMRELFGTHPWRDHTTDEPVVLSIQNFKGGVGKSTVTVSLSQYLAKQGYRVCVVDCDPQASTTALFGINPDLPATVAENPYTLKTFLSGEIDDLRQIVQKTYWDQLDLIPSNLDLFDSEYELASMMGQGDGAVVLKYLSQGIDQIKDKYDVILLDAPPALGMISLSVLNAATAMLIPVKPNILDFSSTAKFLTMLHDNLQTLNQHGAQNSYKFVKVLVNDMDESKSAHVQITEMMRNLCGPTMLSSVMKNSAEIDNASARLKSVYELEGPITSRQTHNRCITYMNAVCHEIEVLIQKTWPSRRSTLRDEGLI